MRKYHYLFYIILFSEKNTILFKNLRQVKHRGNHFRAIGEGIKSFHVYMWENNDAQMEQTVGKMTTVFAQNLVLGLEEGQFWDDFGLKIV